MFADPQSIDYAGGEKPFYRIASQSPNKGSFVWEDPAQGDRLQLDVTQSSTATRNRREIRFTRFKNAVDPLSGGTKQVSASAMVVVDEPKFGFNRAELGAGGLLGSLIDTVRDDDFLVVAQLLRGEN